MTDRAISIECESNFFRHNAAPRRNWTNADQKARRPGDQGFERLALYANGYETG